MKILIVNTFDTGGAANACLRLHQGLLKEGIDSHVLLNNKSKNIAFTNVLKPKKLKHNLLEKLKYKSIRILKELKLIGVKQSKQYRFIKSRDTRLELFKFPNSNFDITKYDLYKDSEIVNLHWVANFLDYKSFFKKNTKPVVWTLHDMNPFSGGEHYTEEYLGIDESGFPVKRNISEEELLVSKKNIAIKIQSLSKVDNLTIVTPSEWLANEAKKSEVFKGFPIYCIPNGLDAEIYKPRDKDYSRELLNIPKDKKVVLFVADSISNNRKGFIFLKKAFEQLANANLVLCAIGSKNSNLESLNNIIELGSIQDERLMSIAYSAADVFVIPSLMDNLPNTVLESLMCGTPVIGFPIGGIPDMIQDGENGFLTKEISVSSLLETLNKFLNSSETFDINKIRENAVKKYDQKIQASNYIKLFESILKESS